jgi:hypothetical protein
MTLKIKSWKDKFESTKSNGVQQTDKGLMYISSPKEISEVIQTVPRSKLITTKQIAEILTKKHKVHFTCPLTTGIFVSVAANYAEELRTQGGKNITPYWRVVKPNGLLYDKYLGSIFPQKEYLEQEGIKIIEKGKNKKSAVENFRQYLIA